MLFFCSRANSGIVIRDMVGKFTKKSFHDVPLDGATVLVRVDYNVPLAPDGTIADDFRIRASLPTIRALQRRRCKIVLCSHLGRPDGKKDPHASLEPVALRLIELLKKPVRFVNDCIGDKVVHASKSLGEKDILLLENLRFYPGEEKNDPNFAKKLALSCHANYFVQDGFGVVHRAHASVDAITQYLPSCAGLLLEKEVRALTSAMTHPRTPFTAILGGAKISDKIGMIEKFVARADHIIIGGALANTILKYRGMSVGKSKVEAGCDEAIKRLYETARAKNADVDKFIILPTDVAVAEAISSDQPRTVVDVRTVGDDDIILDIGTETIERAVRVIEGSKTVIWNGTLGMSELPNFAHGSARVALALAQRKDKLTSVVGGGDTADFVMHWDGHDGASFDHVSTGGGASIELMSGEKLPGVEALMNA